MQSSSVVHLRAAWLQRIEHFGRAPILQIRGFAFGSKKFIFSPPCKGAEGCEAPTLSIASWLGCLVPTTAWGISCASPLAEMRQLLGLGPRQVQLLPSIVCRVNTLLAPCPARLGQNPTRDQGTASCQRAKPRRASLSSRPA